MKNLIVKFVAFFFLVKLISSCTSTPPPGCQDDITDPNLSFKTGLVAYYKFPPLPAPQLGDYGGNGYNLTDVLGSVTPDLSRGSGLTCAMRFNGTNYLLAPSSFPAIGAFSNTPFTVMVTYKADPGIIISPYKFPILIGQICGPVTTAALINPSGGTNFILGLDSCKVPFSLLYPGFVYSGAPCDPIDNTWHNAAVTWNGMDKIKVYQNTVIPSSQYFQINNSAPPLATSCTTPTTIIGYGFKGIIDDIKVWNRLLTTAELNAAFSYDSPCCQ